MGHKPGGFTYFTSLREPIHRVVSQWNWYVPTISLNCSNDPSLLPRCSSALSSPSLPRPANPIYMLAPMRLQGEEEPF